jgi:hypothetical protein
MERATSKQVFATSTAGSPLAVRQGDSRMAGNVYLFNLYNEPITGLSVNGYSAGNVSGYANGSTGTPIYTPASLSVARSKYQGGSAAFAIGGNSLVIPWDSFRGTTTVSIPDPSTAPVSLDDSLLLLVAVNEAMLMTTRGYVLSTFQVNVSTMSELAVEPDPA